METQKSTAFVSVVIVNYNAGDLLRNCVASALEQADEVIVVDNASADGSIALVEKDCSPDRLKIIRNANNLGFAAGCNIGTRAALGEYLFFLNPDCVLAQSALSAMLAAMQSDPRIGMAGGVLVNPDGTEQGGARRAVPTPWRSFSRATRLSRFSHRWPRLFDDFHLHKQPLPDEAIEVEAISGACMLVRREALNGVGPLDEGYFMHCEDLDWCMRFRLKGWKILFVPDARLVHHKGACSRSRSLFVEWHKHRGMIRFYRKFFRHQYPSVLMYLVAVGVWLRFALVAMWVTLRRACRALGDGRG